MAAAATAPRAGKSSSSSPVVPLFMVLTVEEDQRVNAPDDRILEILPPKPTEMLLNYNKHKLTTSKLIFQDVFGHCRDTFTH